MVDTLSPLTANLDLNTPSGPGAVKTRQEAWEAAQAFEGMMLGQLMRHMMTGLKADGPFAGGFAETMWRDMLVEEAGEQAAAAGGIGLAGDVYRVLVATLPDEGTQKPEGNG